jgi:tetratricopeptide (TPR) repeat protein
MVGPSGWIAAALAGCLPARHILPSTRFCRVHFTLPQAIKMYRMALDQIPPATSRDLRLKIQRNIGHALVRQGQFQDAITAFESIMEAAPGEERWQHDSAA